MHEAETNKNLEDGRVVEETKDVKIFSSGLIISLILSVVSVVIFTWLIFSLIDPLEHPVMYYTIRIVDENFFLRIINTEEILPGQWVKPVVEYKIGFYILVPIALVCFVISGLTVLVKEFKRTKLLILVNWILYLIPIISSLFVNEYSYVIQWGSFVEWGAPATAYFKWFFLINIPLQISMLVFQEDFYQWVLSPIGQTKEESGNNFRTVTFFMFYTLACLTLIIFTIDYDFYFEFGVMLGLSLAFLSIWWGVGDSIRLILLMNKREEEFSKTNIVSLGFFSIVIGAVILIINIILGIITSFSYIPILFFFSCLFLIIGIAIGSLVSSSILGKIGYSINALCLFTVTILFIVLVSIMGYSDLFA